MDSGVDWQSVVAGAGMTVLAHPFTYVKVLVQVCCSTYFFMQTFSNKVLTKLVKTHCRRQVWVYPIMAESAELPPISCIHFKLHY